MPAETVANVHTIDRASALQPLNRDEFEAFYAQTAAALGSYITHVSGNTALADDILQEAYIRLLNSAPVEEARRRSYLFRTATNLMLDHFRAQRRERSWLSSLWRRSAAAGCASPVTIDVQRVFAMLSVRERSLMWLAYVEGADHHEIARTLGCGKTSVRVLLFRARRKMEALLRENNISVGDLR